MKNEYLQESQKSVMIESPINGFEVEIINGDFRGKDFVSIEQLTHPSEIERIFEVADQMEEIVESGVSSDLFRDIGVTILFYQPSTRTRTSFESATQWLGSRRVVTIAEMGQFSSAVKGESLPDTIMSIEQTTACDLIVLRHPGDNSSFEAAHFAQKPVINAGSGKLEHPTQAVLDLRTIKKHLGTMDGLHVAMLGDLKYGRTVKSLAKLLALVDPNTQLSFISPEVLQMPRDEISSLEEKGVGVFETDNLLEVLPEADVLYVTRIQREWFDTPELQEQYDQLKGQYQINREVMQCAKDRMIVMHPLPRVNEIAYHMDDDPRSVYFPQMRSGLVTRMALMSLIMGRI